MSDTAPAVVADAPAVSAVADAAPVVAAAEPAATPAPAAAEAPVTPVEGGASAPAEPVTPAAAAEPDPFDDPATDAFPRAYVEKLRRENADRRTAVQPYEDAFSGFADQPETVSALQGFIRNLADDPGTALKQIVGMGKQIAGEEWDSVATSKEPEYLTAEQADAIAEQKVQAAAQKQAGEQAVKDLEAKVSGLGYKGGNGEFDPERTLLYAFVQQNPEFDYLTGDGLTKADESVKAFKQGIVDAYIEQVRLSGERYPKTPTQNSGTGAADGSGHPPKNLVEAKAAVFRRLNAIPGQ